MTYKRLLSKTISVKLSFLLLLQQSIIAGEIVSDVTANSSFQATVEKSQNGIPVVNIVVPNEQGLSHNKFSDYNVNKEGAILNNSNKREVNTQLAGYIYGNNNLAGRNTANTILNEVTSRNKTELKGFTEVAGDRANVIIANPNGVYINGAGFINTQKATITTGAVNLQNGSVNNYRVDKGEIQIDGDGLNTSNVDKAELYSKVVKINAKIHAQDLDIVTGKNDILNDGSVKKIEELDNEKPEVSIDSSNLGGIYANKISLVGTQDGVGINLPIEITAQDDFKLSADGKITLDKVVSNKDLEIKSTSNDVSSNIIYANNVNVEVKNEIKNKDIIASKKDINLKATKIVNENLIASGVNEDLKDSTNGNININSQNLDNKKTLYSKDNININSKSIENENGIIKVNKNLQINTSDFKGDNSKLQASNIDIKADNFEANNSKIIAISGDINLNSKDLSLNSSLLSASEYLDINTEYLKNISGYIQALNNINIISKNLDNSNGTIVTNENLNISSINGTFINQNGILQSNKNLQLDILNFKGDNSKLEASNINIKADILEAKNSNIVATNGNLDIKTNSLNLDNSVQIASMKNLSITSNESKLNNSKILSQNGNIILNSKDLELNSSNVTSLEKMDIKSDSLKSKNGNIQALKDINITSKIIDNQNGVIITNENLTIKSQKDGFFNNTKGILQSNKNLQINTSDFKGDNSKLQASNIDIKADNFEAKDLSAIATDNNLILESNSSILENSYLQAKNNLNLNSNSLNLKDNMIISTNLNLNANEINLDGTSQTKNILLSTNDIFINSKKLISNYLFAQSNNDININSSNIDLKNSKFQSVAFKGDINLITSNLNLYNTALASKDINLKNEANEEIINLIIESSSLDVNNDINMATLNLSSKNSKYLASNNLDLNTNRSVVFLNNSFSANNINLSVNEDLILDKTNNLEAQNTLILNTKSLVNNAQFISNGDLTINTSDFIVNNSLLNAKNALKLNATNYILNNDSNELIFGIRAAYTNLNTKLLTNNGFISSLYDMNIKVDDLINYGGIASANGENKASNMNIEAINVTNYNTIYSNDNINLYVKNSLLNETNKNYVSGLDYARIYSKNNINLAKDDNNYTNSITNKSAIIETQNGDISVWANTFTNRRILEYTDEAFLTTSKVTDSIYFEEGKPYPNKGENGIVNNFFITRGQDIHLYALDSEFSLIIDLAREPFPFHYATVEVSLDKKIQYDNPLYKAAQINAGRNLNMNVKNIDNQISTISAIKDVNFNTDNITNYYNKSYNTNISFKTYHERQGEESAQKGTLRRGDIVLRTTGGNVWGDYDYGTYETIQSVELGGRIIAGENINGVVKSLINGTLLDNQIIFPTTHTPTTDTTLKTANVQTDKKETENKNIEERDKSSIKVKNEDLNSNDLENIIVLNPIDETFQLPTNKYSMFTTVNPNKNLNYLVESNPLYTNYSNFIGSSYFLEKMNYQGDRITKRLGDAGYETKLISDSIFKQTGQRFLGNYTSENAQFVALMDSAINLSGILGLEVGKSLTPEQLASLTEDIVWMEEKVVAGQIVLAPVVYLAGDYNKAQGAIIQAKNIDLEIKENLVNSGTIKTDEYLNINANSIVNNSGVILSDGKATLISNDDFVNKNGGLIKASDIQIASLTGSVINETYSKTNTITQGKNDITYTNLGKTSTIEAINKNLIIQAKDNITNIGANLIAKDNLLLQTQNGDVNLQAIKLENGHNLYFNGGFDKAKDVEYQTSNVKANNVVINSGNNINLEASKLNADNQINLNAINDVNILALNNEYYRDRQTTKKGTFSKKTQRDMVYKETVNSSELNANDIYMTSGNNINLEAVNINAKNEKIAHAQNSLNILAKIYKEGELHHTSKSSFGGMIKNEYKYEKDNLKIKSSEITANNVILDAKTINLEASKLKANQIEITTDILNMISSKESLYENEFSNKGGIITATIENKGKIEEIVIPSTIEVNDKLIFNRQDITSQLEPDNLVKILSSQENLTNEQINLVKQIANSKEWHDKTTTLSGMGALIVTAVVTYLTAGAGAGIAGSLSGATAAGASATATQIATQAAVQAVIQSVTTQVSVQLASSAITGNKVDLDLDSIAKSAVTAGVLNYANGLVNGIDNLDKITKTVTNTTIQSGLQSVVFKTDFKDTLVSNLAMAGTNLAFENVGDYEVSKLKQGNTSWSDGSLNKTLLHSLVGGTVSAIQNKDILSGVLSAGLREALSPLTVNSEEKTQLLASQLTGILVGGLIGGEEGANNGYIISTSAEQYNRQLHQDEAKFLTENIEKFKEYIANKYHPIQGAIISANAEELLFQGANYLIDENTKNSIDNNTTSTPFPKEQLLQDVKEFLELQSKGLSFTDIYKESMVSQSYFTSTDEQYKNSNWKPDSTKGLEDNSLTFVPTVKVGQTVGNATKEVSPVVIKKTGQVYDDVTLGMIQGANSVVPNITNKYILDPTNSLKIIGFGEVVNDIFNESSPIPSTVKGTIGSLLNNISNENEKSIQEKLNYLNKNLDNSEKDILDEK